MKDLFNKTTCPTIIGTPWNSYERNVTEAFFFHLYFTFLSWSERFGTFHDSGNPWLLV